MEVLFWIRKVRINKLRICQTWIGWSFNFRRQDLVSSFYPLADESKELEEESEISLPEESDYSDEEELATDDANTSKDLEEVEGENVTETQEEKVETEIPPPTDPKPVQFSFFSGFTRISKPSSNEIKNKIINIIESTEGNLQVMDANRNQLGDFIGQHEKSTRA